MKERPGGVEEVPLYLAAVGVVYNEISSERILIISHYKYIVIVAAIRTILVSAFLQFKKEW